MSSQSQNRLTAQVEALSHLLGGPELLTLSQAEREDLQSRAADIRERLRTIDQEMLCVGLLGGTGVGKSSLMNALAGGQVASTSHRRPHTDRVLVYLHRDMALPELVTGSGLTFLEIRHDLEPVRHMLLCDLPDFDSLIAEHRHTVLAFLQHLDLLVWIASPEKYADKSFYDFLLQAPKAGPNFFFLLNKADQLGPSDGSRDSSQLQAVSDRFLDFLRSALAERGEADPKPESRTYIVSTVSQSAAWNQLALFREHLFTRRSLKQVSRIKAANLAEEISALVRPLQRELAEASRSREQLVAVLEGLRQEGQSWRHALERPAASLIDQEIEPRLHDHPANLRLLLGPGRWIGRLVIEWRGSGRRGGQTDGVRLPDELGEIVQDRLQQFADRAATKLLQGNLPESLRHRVEAAIKEQAGAAGLIDEWRWFLQTAVDEFSPPARPFFILKQTAVYALLIGLLLLALGGRQPWTALFLKPDPGKAVDLFFSILQTTFSQTGLAALLSLFLLSLLAGLHFYKASKKRAARQVRRYVQAAQEQLLTSWEAQRSGLLESISSIQSELDSHIQALRSHLEGTSRGPFFPDS